MKVILDMDPGVDDAVALILALNNAKLEVLGVSTVAGNVPVELTTANALKIVEQMNKQDVQVHRGAPKPLVLPERGMITAPEIHSQDGLGNSGFPPSRLRESKIPAVEAMSDLLKTHKDREISLIATGPLTNIALVKQHDPDSFARIGIISIMGGVYDQQVRGNVNEFAEFNFYCDPDAASAVLEPSKGPKIIAAGLDVTSNNNCAVDSKMLSEICAIEKRAAKIACTILKEPVRVHQQFHLHDVFAVFALMHPGVFEFRQCASVSVDTTGKFRGMCRVSLGPGRIDAIRTVYPEKFVKYLLDGFGG